MTDPPGAPPPPTPPADPPGPGARVLVVDVANVMGSRPDGWWRDRAGAATRLLAQLAAAGPAALGADRIVAVVEGQARHVEAPDGIELVRAPRDGDTAIAEVAELLAAAGDVPLVVTADRGLRARLPAAAEHRGPGPVLDRLGGRS